MATLPVKAILQMTNYSGHHGLLGAEAPTQTFKYGNLISPNASGLYQETAVGAGAATARNKLAAADGQNSATPSSSLPYVDPTDDSTFAITLISTTAPVAANLIPGTRYGLGKDAATGIHGALFTDTVNQVWELVAYDGKTVRRGVVGTDLNIEVYAKLLAR